MRGGRAGGRRRWVGPIADGDASPGWLLSQARCWHVLFVYDG
jgi:hypothetical protein